MSSVPRTADPSDPGSLMSPRLLTRAFVALRVFTGLVWLSNGLAKAAHKGSYDLGVFSFGLIDTKAARGILTDAASKTQITPLGALYRHLVLPHWDLFAVVLTLSEIAVGIGLLLGVASRLAAVGGLLLIGPIWVMLWHRNLYLWEYPAEDLFPLVLLAIVPTGRVSGVDGRLAPRFGYRWPF